MTDYEDILHQSAEARGWLIEVGNNRISLSEVPYRQEAGGTGRCQITVDTQDDGLTMITPSHIKNARHAATLSGVSGGRAYQANGEPVGNVLWTDGADRCVISIMPDAGEYMNAWHALIVYATSVASPAGREEQEQVERIFEFEIEGEDSRDMRVWRDRARGQKIEVVGLGGVGLWILDLMSKTYVSEISIWDGDEIEGRNLLRSPGWASQEAIGKNKAEHFGGHYQRVRKGISIHPEYWQQDIHENVFDESSFVFIAVDKADVRTALCETLVQKKIPFIDVGMGIELEEGRVRGSCQVFYSGEVPGRWRNAIPTAEGADGAKAYYDLQLADLGALNAALAVGVWRRHIGQYGEEEKDWLTRYSIEENDLLKRAEQT